MDSQRQEKINRLLQKELGEIFRVQMQPYFPGLMMSVTFVRITPDLSLARVNLSLFPAPKEGKEAVLKTIKGHAAEIRYLLGQKVHNQLRIMPQLQFFIDDTLDRVARIDELLATCWINREREMFDTPDGIELMKSWGLPDGLMGVGALSLGYADGALDEPKPRKEDYFRIIK